MLPAKCLAPAQGAGLRSPAPQVCFLNPGMCREDGSRHPTGLGAGTFLLPPGPRSSAAFAICKYLASVFAACGSLTPGPLSRAGGNLRTPPTCVTSCALAGAAAHLHTESRVWARSRQPHPAGELRSSCFREGFRGGGLAGPTAASGPQLLREPLLNKRGHVGSAQRAGSGPAFRQGLCSMLCKHPPKRSSCCNVRVPTWLTASSPPAPLLDLQDPRLNFQIDFTDLDGRPRDGQAPYRQPSRGLGPSAFLNRPSNPSSSLPWAPNMDTPGLWYLGPLPEAVHPTGTRKPVNQSSSEPNSTTPASSPRSSGSGANSAAHPGAGAGAGNAGGSPRAAAAKPVAHVPSVTQASVAVNTAMLHAAASALRSAAASVGHLTAGIAQGAGGLHTAGRSLLQRLQRELSSGDATVAELRAQVGGRAGLPSLGSWWQCGVRAVGALGPMLGLPLDWTG